MWQMDATGHFSLGSDEFISLIGARTAAGFGQLWSDIAKHFGLDPEGRVLKAFATHNTWSGITLDWPVDGGGRLPVELSGLPVFDRARNFAGYRGFGVCRDLDALARLAALRRYEFFHPPAPQPLSADIVPPEISVKTPSSGANADSAAPTELSHLAPETSQPTDLDTAVDTPNELPEEAPKNVLPFRPISEPKSPGLTPVENSAFNELARQLAERLEREKIAPASPQAETPEAPAAAIDPPPAVEETAAINDRTAELAGAGGAAGARRRPPRQGAARSDAGRRPDLPARSAALRQCRVPRADRLRRSAGAGRSRRPRCALCRTRRILGQQHIGYRHAGDDFRDAGISEHALPATTEARLYTIAWDGEQALALIFSGNAGTAEYRRRARRTGGRADLRGNSGAVAGRPRQRRRSRRHPRHHGRRHRDVRRRGQHQFGQPQRRSAVRP